MNSAWKIEPIMHVIAGLVNQEIFAIPMHDTEFDWDIPLTVPEFICRMFHFLDPLGYDDRNSLQPHGSEPVQILYVGLIYLKRIGERILISQTNVLMLFMFSCILADKFMNDEYLDLMEWSKFMFISKEDMRWMEIKFCDLMRWDFRVPVDEYCTLVKRIEQCLYLQIIPTKKEELDHSSTNQMETMMTNSDYFALPA